MGRPTRRQVESGEAFEHVDLKGNTFQIANTFTNPLLEIHVASWTKGDRRSRSHCVLTLDAIRELYDYLDRWLLTVPPDAT